MADDSYLDLVCVVEGDSDTFRVRVPFGSDVYELKKIIMEEGKLDPLGGVKTLKLRKVRLIRGSSPIMISEWTLSQVNIDMQPVGWSHFEINDNDENLTGWRTISTYWEKQPRRDHLQVVVQLPASPVVQAPVPVVETIVTVFEIELRRFCAKYWGKGDDGRKAIYQEAEVDIPPVDVDVDTDLASGPIAASTSYKYISLGSDYEHFFGRLASILVREEYYAMMDILQGIYDKEVQGVVVLGRPGIGKNSHYRRLVNSLAIAGKTTFLYFVLIERILAAKPSLLQLDPHVIFFVDGTLKVFSRGSLLDPGGHPGVWALVDSNANLSVPDPVFTGLHSSFFVVQASSPNTARYKSWKRQLSAKLVVMKEWSWEEIYITGSALSLHHLLILIFVFSRTQLRKWKFEENLQLTFKRYGGSARHCFDLARDSISTRGWEATLKSMDCVPELSAVELALRDDNCSAEHNQMLQTAPSQILTIIPDDYRQPLVNLATRHVADHFYEAILRNNAAKFWLYFNQFSSQPESRGTAGWLWEKHVLKTLRSQQGQILPMTPLVSRPPKKRRRNVQNVTIPFDVIVEHGGVDSVAQKLSTIIPFGRSVLFIPGAKNAATFDAFSITENRGVDLFQSTIAPGDHDLKPKGLDFIWDSVNAAMELLKEDTSRSNALSKLLPNHGPKWSLIFAVPAKMSGSWKHPRDVNFGGKNPKRAWDNYLAQYVMVVKETGTHIFIFDLFSSDIFPYRRTPRTLTAAR
jgi:hypothetical protein